MQAIKSFGLAMLAALAGCDSSIPPRESLAVVVEIHVEANGGCRVDQVSVPCESVGSAMRSRFPDSNPEFRICPSKQSRYEPTAALMRSLQDARFPKLEFGCATPEA
jgi:hypothetical protein